MSAPELKIENQLCYLVHRLDQALLARYRPLLEGLSLTYTQYMAMLVLWDRGEQSIGALCTAMGLDTGTVSPLVKRLERSGYVLRRRDRKDERSVKIELTQEGRALSDRAESVPGTIASCLLAREDEYLELRGLLERLLARLEENRD